MAWLVLTGALVWQHAAQSVWPPIYDAYTYFLKANAVWASLAANPLDLTQLLAVEPTFRPIGTVLMSFPFGFSTDFRGFYFRSTFLPVLLVCIAGLVGSWTSIPSPRYRATAALTACFLSTLSIFFDFELYDGGPPAISYWGLVDGFLTGLASVAMAAGARSVLSRSPGWAVTATIVSFVVIFVKPSGLLIAAVCGAILAIGWLWRLREDWPTPRRRSTLRQTASILVIEAVVLGGGALLALGSAYLSSANLTYGNAAIDIMRAELQIDWRTQIRIALDGLGPFVPLWLCATAATWIVVRVRRPAVVDRSPASRADDLLLLMGLVTLIGGLWFWIFGSGGRTLVRYFAPFLYVAIFCALPALLKSLEQAPPFARRAIGALMVFTMVNLAALLIIPDPAPGWQKLSGVNVKSGTRPASIDQSESLLKSPHAAGKSVVNVYSFTENLADAMYESVFDLHGWQAPIPSYKVVRPFDWQRPTAFRFEEILSSDYLLVDPSFARDRLPASVATFEEERTAFNTWANGLVREDGVEKISVQPRSVLLRIDDPKKLRSSLEAFIAAHRWRDVFVAENSPRWWSNEKIGALAPSATAAENVDFGGLVDLRRATVARGADGSMLLKVWVRGKADATGDDWVMLIHMLDDQNHMIANRDRGVGRLEGAPPGRPYALLQLRFVPPAQMRKIAVGFYRGTTMLKTAQGETDWGGIRLLLPLPPKVS